MASSSDARRNKTPKPSWADMVTGEKPNKETTKDEPMEEEGEEWWQRDWKKKGQSWDQWWQDKRQEWDEWKKSEKEEMQREEEEYQQRLKAEQERQHKEEEKEEEKRDSKGLGEEKSKEEEKLSEDNEEAEEVQPKNQQPPTWKNRTGSQKERARRRWVESKAEEQGLDIGLARLGALGGSRMRRLVSRQEDRATMKETVESAERAAEKAAVAAQAAQAAGWQSWYQQQEQQWQQWHWQQQQQQQQQQWGWHYSMPWVYHAGGLHLFDCMFENHLGF